jgi:serine protease Do
MADDCLSVRRIGWARRRWGVSAIVIACSIGSAVAIETVGFKASLMQNRPTWFTSPVEAGGFANAVDVAKPAVISVRAKHPASESSGAGSSDQSGDSAGDPHGKSFAGRGQRVRTSQGSGFFISADGYAVTNQHVAGASDSVEIVTDEQKTYKAKVVGADATSDIALLKVDGRSDFAYVKFADKSPRVGDRIFAVGNPFGLGGTVTAGIVSARERSIASEERPFDARTYDDLIQIDAAINRGNSGGPSFDSEGKVIGVNSVILSPTGGSIGIGFAVPAQTAKAIIAQLMEAGSVTRGWLGIEFQPLTPAIADVLELKEARGALVAEPLADGPAKKAGIVAGDVITAINGEAIKDNRDVTRKMIGLAPGTAVDIGVLREGKENTISVTLSELPAAKQTRAAALAHPAAAAPRPPAPDLGLKLAPAPETPGDNSHGVIVVGIDPNGRGADLGIEPGDIILEVSRKAMQTPDDIRNALDDARQAGHEAALMRVKSGKTMRFVAVPVSPT